MAISGASARPVKPPERIQTARLVLRPWRATDAPVLRAAIDGNLQRLQAWMPWAMQEPSSLHVIEQRIDKFDRGFRSGIEWLYAIFSYDESALYGGAGLHPRIGKGGVEIGYWLQQAWTGKGFATEAVKALTEVGFTLPDIERVQIRCDPRNTESAAVARRAGFRHVTTLEKDTLDPKGAPRDTMVWELTRSRAVPRVESVPRRRGRGRFPKKFAAVALGLLALCGASALYTQLEVRRAEARFPAAGRFMTVNGVRLHYVDEGNGEPIVLLHGNPGFVHDFLPIVDSLARARRVIAFDRPGHGYSERLSASGTTPRDQVRLIHDALAQLGVTRATFVGHSWGGALALLYALEHPANVREIVVIGTRAFASDAPADRVYALNRVPVAGALLRHTVMLPAGRSIVDRRLAAAYAPDSVRHDHWQAARTMWLRPSQVAATVWDTWNLNEELLTASARYGTIRAPVTVIAGERDASLAESKRLYDVFGPTRARLIVVENAGHEVQFTRPAAVLRALRR